MLRCFFSRLFYLSAWVCSWIPFAYADQLIPVNVILNTVVKGNIFVIQTARNDILVAADDLKQLGITHRGAVVIVDNREFISLSSLNVSLQYQLDERTSSLMLTVDPRLLQKTVVDYSITQGPETNQFRIDSAFVNYAVTRRAVIGQEIVNLDVPFEGIVAAHGVIVRSQLAYHQLPGDQYWARGFTSVIKDRQQDMQRITLGDFIATSGEFGGSGIFAGLSVNKNFTLTPYFNKNPGVNFAGLLETPSKVDVYVNDTLVRSEQLPAGRYELNNLPNIFGSGVARLVITDAFGRQYEELFPYYAGTRLLKPNLQEYSYNIGVTRDSLESFRPQYGSSVAILGFHRKGINRQLTAGLQFEYLEDRIALRPEISLQVGNAGELEIGGGYSQDNNDTGTLRFIRHIYTSRYFHSSFSYHDSTDGYRTIAWRDGNDPVTRYFNATIGLHGTIFGAMSVSYNNQRRLSSTTTDIYSFIYNLRLPKQLSLIFRASRNIESGQISDNYFASINAILGRWSSANFAYTQDGAHLTRSGYVQRSVPHGTGLGLRARISGDEQMQTADDLHSDVTLFYKAKYGMFNGNYYSEPAGQAYLVSASGSLAYIGGGFFLTRPITDGFGLVKVGKLDGVRVYYSSELIGETDGGKLLLPNLASYAPNVVSIEPQDVPPELSLTSTRQTVIPSFRNGSVVEFPVSVFQGFSGKTSLTVRGKTVVTDYGDIVFQSETKTFRSPIGRKGEFYFENIPPGAYKATTIVEKIKCQREVIVPKSEATLVQLGEVHCAL